jgi:hypothetical protein
MVGGDKCSGKQKQRKNVWKGSEHMEGREASISSFNWKRWD